jgi:LCP family protein required for cell wall assembly
MQDIKQSFKKPNKRKIAISRFKRRLLRHVWLVRTGLIALILLGFYLLYFLISLMLGKLGVTSYLGLIGDFVFTPTQKIQTREDRTNILILGKGGEGHEAPDLTDTVIFASITHVDPSLSLVSLPRDIWIPELRAKLNSTYYWGNQKKEGGGLILTKSTVESIVGQPVHYGLVIDFSGFMKIVDVLGGVEVDVERGFVDEKYPITGKEDDECDGDLEYKCRYETVRFEKGAQTMGGETALIFARSRNAEGDEGPDLAREIRQQKILAAIQAKTLSSEVLFSPKKILSVWEAVRESVETDIDPSVGAVLARRLFQTRNQIESHVLSEDLLINPPVQYKYDNLYVFIPEAGDWEEVHSWVENILTRN